MEHYFTNNKNLKSNIQEFKIKFRECNFVFKTDNGVFSKGEIDYGTWLLLDTLLNLDLKGKVLDLGCGYGIIGIVIAKLSGALVTMIDINERAVHLAKMNIKGNNCSSVLAIVSDGFSLVQDKFDYIVSNPPIRIGKVKLYELLNDALHHLNKNGTLYIVVRKEQGAKSLMKTFAGAYQVEVLNKSKGFYIISLKCC